MSRLILALLSCALLMSTAPAHAKEPTDAEYRALPNLVQNAGFESDWMHNKVSANTRFMLLEQSDWGYAQSDGLPDSWVIRATGARRDKSAAKFGKASLRLSGEASQVVYLCGETDPADGGNGYNTFRPLPPDLQKHLKDGPLRVGAWCRTQGATAEPAITVTVEYASGDKITPKAQTATFAKGTHEWEYKELAFPPAPELGIAHAAVIKFNGGEGQVWFDGVSAVHDLPADEPDLLANGNFEAVADDYPLHWSKPVLWSWSRREYYRFTGWSHEKGAMRGGATLVPTGAIGALALHALPGDNFAVKSDPATLNQPEPRPLRLTARVWADNVRWFEVMAEDETGEWLPQHDLAGFMGTDEHYRNRIQAAGTHDWEYVSKYFTPRRPVKRLTVWLCIRGVDGRQMGKNVVGTAWVDDVVLREAGSDHAALTARGLAPPPPATGARNKTGDGTKDFWREAAAALRQAFREVQIDVDFGERLWGANKARLRLHVPGKQMGPNDLLEGDTGITLLPPKGPPTGLSHWTRIPDPETAEVVVPYRVGVMCENWEQQYRLADMRLAFGTPPSPVAVRATSTYAYPDERVDVGVNLNVTRKSLAEEVGGCRVTVKHPGGERVLLDTPDVLKALWTPDAPRPVMLDEGHVDARNLIALSIDPAGLPVHPYNAPVRDCTVVVTLTDKAGKTIAERASEPFGFMRRPPAGLSLPETIESTSVSPAGLMLVNGRPFFFHPFPTEKADLGGMSRTHHFPKTHKILPLPFPEELLFKPDEDAAWKQKVQDFVRQSKDDPKLFGYYFAHNGETTFWFDAWREMAACQRKVTGWAREVDSKHLILSAEWLFGHGALKPEAARHFDFLDVIDVEPGLRWTPDSHAVRQAIGRPVAIVAGLETYYSQPPALIRWRAYEALRQGASDVGICPSAMLYPKPETVSFLRGLYGEMAGLEPMLAAPPPPQPAACDSPAVTLWERQDGATRYLVAMRGGEDKPVGPVTFTLPAPVTKVEVMFEGRQIAPAGGKTFSDTLAVPYTTHVYRVSH